jgi:glycosyltransferase involved in cell wall biosynthesis
VKTCPRVLVNATGSVSGGGRTWVLAVTRELARGDTREVDWTFYLEPEIAALVERRDGLVVLTHDARSAMSRVVWEQLALPREQHSGRWDLLISAANFAPVRTRAQGILMCRNALHYVPITMKGTGAARLRIEAALARLSASRARAIVTASRTMADLVRPFTSRPIRVIPFGPGLAEGSAPSEDGRFTFLHRTAWGPHKRFGDLLRAVQILALEHPDAFVVRSACAPDQLEGAERVSARRPSSRSFSASAGELRLLEDPVIASHIELNPFVPGEQSILSGDAVIVPSTVESFCFPLAEAVRFGIPVVAVDAPFAREMCGDAAFYASPGSPESLAQSMSRLLAGERPPPPAPVEQERLSWPRHVDGLAALCHELALPGWINRARSSRRSAR